jgi:Anti-sigma-K factor rskA, C-terminal
MRQGSHVLPHDARRSRPYPARDGQGQEAQIQNSDQGRVRMWVAVKIYLRNFNNWPRNPGLESAASKEEAMEPSYVLLCGAMWSQFGDEDAGLELIGQQLAKLQSTSAQQQAELHQAKDLVSTLTANDAMRVTLVAAKTPPQPQGKAIYLRRRGSLIFLANNFAPLPPKKAYELWLIPATGSPIPAGVFKPDARGSATLVNPPLPQGV